MPPILKKPGTKIKPQDIKAITSEGAKSVIEFFLGNDQIKNAYIKVLHDSGMCATDIQKVTHTSAERVRSVIKNFSTDAEDGMVETLKNIELNRLYMIGGKILEVMSQTDKIEGMKGGDLAYAYKTFLEARRLLENKSTGNISVLITTLTKKFEEEGGRIDTLMRSIAKKNPNVIEENAVAEVRNSG